MRHNFPAVKVMLCVAFLVAFLPLLSAAFESTFWSPERRSLSARTLRDDPTVLRDHALVRRSKSSKRNARRQRNKQNKSPAQPPQKQGTPAQPHANNAANHSPAEQAHPPVQAPQQENHPSQQPENQHPQQDHSPGAGTQPSTPSSGNKFNFDKVMGHAHTVVGLFNHFMGGAGAGEQE
ncbi:hypothetical protein FISHEDRAFT_62016 [Fistulina hepatica ATCC 64428]|nr:hypothetical protein FISHEDRAFT_62016 [Fistulina hepatica ATCC 64428]